MYDFLRTLRVMIWLHAGCTLVVGLPVWVATGAKTSELPAFFTVLIVGADLLLIRARRATR